MKLKKLLAGLIFAGMLIGSCCGALNDKRGKWEVYAVSVENPQTFIEIGTYASPNIKKLTSSMQEAKTRFGKFILQTLQTAPKESNIFIEGNIKISEGFILNPKNGIIFFFRKNPMLNPDYTYVHSK